MHEPVHDHVKFCHSAVFSYAIGKSFVEEVISPILQFVSFAYGK
jgi:hypothetical protein